MPSRPPSVGQSRRNPAPVKGRSALGCPPLTGEPSTGDRRRRDAANPLRARRDKVNVPWRVRQCRDRSPRRPASRTRQTRRSVHVTPSGTLPKLAVRSSCCCTSRPRVVPVRVLPPGATRCGEEDGGVVRPPWACRRTSSGRNRAGNLPSARVTDVITSRLTLQLRNHEYSQPTGYRRRHRPGQAEQTTPTPSSVAALRRAYRVVAPGRPAPHGQVDGRRCVPHEPARRRPSARCWLLGCRTTPYGRRPRTRGTPRRHDQCSVMFP
jgi:hypothetical protein